VAQKRGGNREIRSPASVEGEVKEALGKGGDSAVWVRDDGAICVGDECIVIKPSTENDSLDIEVKPDKCGEAAGSVILDYLIRTAGKGINIKIPPVGT